MRVRGVIEGFYGPPWSQEERLDLIAFCGREGLNTWVHAPKDDPYHRARWREPYPDGELERFGELVRAADAAGVEFVWAIAPGLSMRYSSDDELGVLVAKCEQLRSAGVRSFQLLWDDVEHDLHGPEDEARYGDAERPSGAAQADVSNRFRRAFPQPGPLVVCPIGYAGTGDSPYRRTFGSLLDAEIVVYWTGPEVVSLGIGRESLDAAVERFRGHELLLWDNYPVNDFDTGRLFLGPLRGRDPLLAEGRLAGIVANAMLQAVPSKLALATVADWAGDPRGYDPYASFQRALLEYGAEVLEAVRVLTAADGSSASALRGSSGPAPKPPADPRALADELTAGVDARTAAALLEPFV